MDPHNLLQSNLIANSYIVPLVIAILVAIKIYFNGGVFKHSKVDLSGKSAIVTGGNSGIGA